MTLDDYLKIAQIIFYIGTFFVAVFTFISAKKGLLNTVNTEYQKKVIERLKSLSDELYDEFDENSKNYWANNYSMEEVISEINKEFLAHKDDILRLKKFEGGYRIGQEFNRLTRLVNQIKSDPFIPSSIREIVVDLLDNRARVIFNSYIDAIKRYRSSLAKGMYLDTLEDNHNWIHNEVNDALYSQGCGISQIEEEVHKIRMNIQKYFEKYNPIK